MNNIHNKFVDMAALRAAIANDAPRLTTEIEKRFEREIHERKQKTLLFAMLIPLNILSAVLPFIFPYFATTAWTLLIFLLLLPTGFFLYQAITAWQRYAAAVDRFLHEYVFTLFDLTATHRKEVPYEVQAELQASRLLTEPNVQHHFDDGIATTYLEHALAVSELECIQTRQTGRQKRRFTIFKGIFVRYTLPTKLSGTTYISTEGDTYGYAHRSFWSTLLGTSKVEETVLEWNEFENALHVATDDPSEARYILTPDLMADLYDWWKETKRNIRLRFSGDTFYLLFPDQSVSIKKTVHRLRPEHLEKYILSIAAPLWHVLLLIEDLRTRFR